MHNWVSEKHYEFHDNVFLRIFMALNGSQTFHEQIKNIYVLQRDHYKHEPFTTVQELSKSENLS